MVLALAAQAVGCAAEDPPVEATAAEGARTIRLGRVHLDELTEGWLARWNRLPTDEELDGLIEQRIREEVLFREALAMQLDQGDPVIRRHLANRVDGVLRAMGDREPTDPELETYLAAHAERYRIPPRLTFWHVYINRDTRGASAEEDAARLLDTLREGGGDLEAAVARGDRFLLDSRSEASTPMDVERAFGRRFAGEVFELTPGQWQGPLVSGYGLHLVYVAERIDGRPAELEDVRSELDRDLRDEWRREAVASNYARMRSAYIIEVEGRSSTLGDAPR